MFLYCKYKIMCNPCIAPILQSPFEFELSLEIKMLNEPNLEQTNLK